MEPRYPIWNIRHKSDYHSIADVILANRSLTIEDLADSPDILNDPYLMKDMRRIVERISEAIRNKERIVVFGDYDVDGVTSTAVFAGFFRSGRCQCHIFVTRPVPRWVWHETIGCREGIRTRSTTHCNRGQWHFSF